MTLQLRRQLAVLRGQITQCGEHIDVAEHLKKFDQLEARLKQAQEEIDDVTRRVRESQAGAGNQTM